MKLTRKVSNRGAYLSAIVHSLFYLGCPIDLGGLLAPPRLGFHRRVVPWSCLGKWRVTCMRVRPDSYARCAVVVGHAQAMSYLTRRCLVNQSASPLIPVSIDFPSALNRGRERVFRPNLSPFSHRCVSSLIRGEWSSRPSPSSIPELPLLLLLPFHRACSHVAVVPK